MKFRVDGMVRHKGQVIAVGVNGVVETDDASVIAKLMQHGFEVIRGEESLSTQTDETKSSSDGEQEDAEGEEETAEAEGQKAPEKKKSNKKKRTR